MTPKVSHPGAERAGETLLAHKPLKKLGVFFHGGFARGAIFSKA
jgi:hypothetical protein